VGYQQCVLGRILKESHSRSADISYRCRILIWSLFWCWEFTCIEGNANLWCIWVLKKLLKFVISTLNTQTWFALKKNVSSLT
jgi:hypothetical protein